MKKVVLVSVFALFLLVSIASASSLNQVLLNSGEGHGSNGGQSGGGGAPNQINVTACQTLDIEGATYVLLPHFVGGKFVATMIDNHGFNLRSFMKEQFKELSHLHKKKGRYKYQH